MTKTNNSLDYKKVLQTINGELTVNDYFAIEEISCVILGDLVAI